MVPEAIGRGRAGRRLALVVGVVVDRREVGEREFAEHFARGTDVSWRGQLNDSIRKAVLDHPPERVMDTEFGPVDDMVASVTLYMSSGDRIGVVARESGDWESGASFTALQRIPPNVTARRVDASDGRALRDLERRTPIVMGDVAVAYDKGEDYFAHDELMGEQNSMVIVVDDAVVGLVSVISREVAVGGVVQRLNYVHRMRIDPRVQGQGMRSVIGFYSMATAPTDATGPYAFIAAGNDRMIAAFPDTEFWSVEPTRIVFDTAALAGPTMGRRASSGDVAMIVDTLNETHCDQELFVPYTPATLEQRLDRVPRAYTWPDITIEGRAVLGVWRADWEVTRTTDEGTDTDRRALVLDYGFGDRASDDLVGLIGSACADLAATGITELAVFSSPGTRGHEELVSIAKRVEPYRARILTPEPPDLAQRGVYVDHIYF